MSTAIFAQHAFDFHRPVSRCSKCGRALTNPHSIHRGTGPICAYHPTDAPMKTSDITDDHIPSDLTNGIILERNDGIVATNVPHLVIHHSPTGYEFGYSGSGPADLALNIVEAALNRLDWHGGRIKCYDGDCFQLSWNLHQDFKSQFIACVPRTGSTIPWYTVIDWITERIPLAEALP